MRGPFRPGQPARPATRISRIQAVRRAARDLQRFAWPRLEMSVLVGVTGLAGFYASVLLASMGVQEMWQRYPLAVAIAYLVFLFELWLWMHARDSADSSDVDLDLLPRGGRPAETSIGEGGSFGGGGASGSWDVAEAEPPDAFEAAGSALDSVGVADVADGEGCLAVVVVVALLALVGSLLFAAFYLVWGAPLLLAELLVDAALSYGLYRNLRRHERGFWMFTAIRRTGLVFLGTACFLSILGAALEHAYPGAHSLGEIMQRGESPK